MTSKFSYEKSPGPQIIGLKQFQVAVEFKNQLDLETLRLSHIVADWSPEYGEEPPALKVASSDEFTRGHA